MGRGFNWWPSSLPGISIPGARAPADLLPDSEFPILRVTLRLKALKAPESRRCAGAGVRLPGVPALAGSQGESTRMDAESTLPAVVQAEPVVGAPSGRYTENAMLGWILVVGLTLVGYLLLALGSPAGAPGWPRHLFLAVGLAGVVCYGLWVFPYFRDLEKRLPEGRDRWSKLERELIAAFEQLGAGDLVRSIDHTRGLPERLAQISEAASEALSQLAQQIQDSSIEVASAADAVNEIASELASGSSQQAASVVEITAAMEELARTASQIAENAGRQAELAARAEASGEAGSAAVFEAVTRGRGGAEADLAPSPAAPTPSAPARRRSTGCST